MAAPATHILLAAKIYDKYFSDKDPQEFYIGTSFPDIRYMGVIDRERTHFHNLNISDLQKDDSFTTGLKFHSLVDEVRQKFMNDRKIYALLPESNFITQALKFFEDQVLYVKIDNWSSYANYFSEIALPELQFGVHRSDLESWHKFLEEYLKSSPTAIDIRNFVKTVRRPAAMADEIVDLVERMQDNQQVISIINDFYDQFEPTQL